MDKIVLYIVGLFFIVGIIDYFLGNKFKLGIYFEDGIKNMGVLALSMIGILSITPIVSDVITKYLVPMTSKIGIDPSIISSSLIAIDMGAYRVAESIANTREFMYFSGVLIASMLGCTISFTLPLAMGIIKKESFSSLCKGILFGIVTSPIGLFIGGVLLKINIIEILINLAPIIILSIAITIGLYLYSDKIIKVFTIIGKIIVGSGFIALAFQGFDSITGIKLIKNLLPLEEAIVIVGKIAIFLGGAYVMVECIKNILKKPLEKVKDSVGINSSSIAALIGSLASAIIVYSSFEDLDDRGKVVCSAFSVGGAYVLGGQLGYVATEAREIIGVYIIVKLVCGVLAILLALLITKD